HPAAEMFFRLIAIRHHERLESLYDRLPDTRVRNRLEVCGADTEDVHHDVIGTGEKVSGQDIDLPGSEGAANFLKQQRLDARSENKLGVAAVRVVDPLDAGGVEIPRLALPLEEMPHGPHLRDDVRSLAEMECG